MKARKLAEANKNLEEAAKAMKTSFFKRKPDLNSATISYAEAAICFYVAEDIESAIDYYEKSAEIDIELEDDLQAATKLEKCAIYSLQLHTDTCEKEARDFYDRCCKEYLMSNSMDKAADCLVKVARVSEKTNLNLTAGYMLKACNLMVNFDRQDFAVDTFNNTLNLLLRIGRLQSAVILLKRMIDLFTKLHQEHNIFKCYLSIVILQLGSGDLPAAQEEFNNHLQVDTYLRSGEIALEEDLIKAFEDFDEDRLEELKNHNQFNFVQQQVIRVGKSLAIACCVPWFCNESEELLRQARGEDVALDLEPGKPIGAPQVKKVKKETKAVSPKEEKSPKSPKSPKEKSVSPKEKPNTPKEKPASPAESAELTVEITTAEEVKEEEKPLSAMEALEKAALEGGDDDEFNLC